MKPIPVTIGDFERIRNDGLLYVDKTAYFHRLITTSGQNFCFVSRPRRFGKSLMITTLKSIFQGRKELFAGLDIARTDYDWKPYPVIHLNFSFCASDEYNLFVASLPVEMERALREVGYTYDGQLSPGDNLAVAIDWLYKQGTPTVILIDEYDDPVARALKNVAMAEKVREDLATIYSKLKDRSGKIRFLILTGVSKFTKMSIFSVLSNLLDISFDDRYATMLGFTEQEMDDYYGEYMVAHAAKMGLPMAVYRAELKRMYNGYRFSEENETTVYNPVSINMMLANPLPRFKCFWTDTGRPAMLLNFLKRENILEIDPDKISDVLPSDFDVTDLEHISIKGLLYQTGYLTIKNYNPLLNAYTLGFPDEEVRRDFSQLLVALMGKKSVSWAAALGVHLLQGQWEAFFAGLKSLYAGVAYGPREERVCEYSYSRCLSFLLQGQGIVCQQEVTQADGRVDMVCSHPCGIFIFELKVGKAVSIAMDQMQRKHYAAPYAADSRPVWLIGLSFEAKTRQLTGTIAERYH